MQAHVFISYTKSDQQKADEVCEFLETQGHPCWIAPRNVRPASDYAEEIVNAIEESPVFVVLLSEEANDSRHVRGEINQAFNIKDKPIIAFRIQEVEPAKKIELFLRSFQWIQGWNPPWEHRLKTLANAVSEFTEPLADDQKAPESVESPHRPLPAPESPPPQIAPVASKTPPEPFRTTPPVAPTPPLPDVNLDTLAAMRKAVDDCGITTKNSLGSVYVVDEHSLAVWRKLDDDTKKQAPFALAKLLNEGTLGNLEKFAVARLLDYGMRQPEVRPYLPSLVRTLVVNCLGVRLAQKAASEAIGRARVERRLKWQILIDAINDSSETLMAELVTLLPAHMPKDCVQPTLDVLIDLLEFSNDFSLVRSAVSALKSIGFQPVLPKLFEIIEFGAAFSAQQVADLLAEQGVVEAIPAIRSRLEEHPQDYGGYLSQFLRHLYRLEGAKAIPDIVEALRECSAPVGQQSILQMAVGMKIKDEALTEVAQHILDGNPNENVKQVVEKLLTL